MKTTKTKSKKKTKQTKVQELVRSNTTLELFLQDIRQLYPLDKVTPGIVLSHLPNNQFYAAVVRYDLKGLASSENPGAKQTLVSVQAPTLSDQELERIAREHEMGSYCGTEFILDKRVLAFGRALLSAAQPTGEAGAEPSTPLKKPNVWGGFYNPAPSSINSNCPKCGRRCELIIYKHMTPSVELYCCPHCGEIETTQAERVSSPRSAEAQLFHALKPFTMVQPPYDHDNECSFCRTKEGQAHPDSCAWSIAKKLIAALPGQPSPAPETSPEGIWVIMYAPTEHEPEIFMGAGAETAARKRYAIAKLNWTCHLLCEARPQPSEGLEQVAREIAEMVANDVYNLTTSRISHFLPLISAILARHFSGGSGPGCGTLEDQMARFLKTYPGCKGHATSCHGLPCEEKMQAFLKWAAKGERP